MHRTPCHSHRPAGCHPLFREDLCPHHLFLCIRAVRCDRVQSRRSIRGHAFPAQNTNASAENPTARSNAAAGQRSYHRQKTDPAHFTASRIVIGYFRRLGHWLIHSTQGDQAHGAAMCVRVSAEHQNSVRPDPNRYRRPDRPREWRCRGSFFLRIKTPERRDGPRTRPTA